MTPPIPPWHHGGSPPWFIARAHKRRSMVRRFVGLFGLLPVLFLIAFGVMLGLFFEPLRSSWPRQGILILAICGVPVVFTILAAVIGSFIFRRMGSPVIDVMAAADAVANGDLSARVRENIPGEFGQLAQSFNRMAAELARAEQQRRNLTADVAHELRTPLHVIQGNLEGILDGVYEASPEQITATLEETRLLARLVEDLQTLSLAEAGQLPLHKTSLSARDLVEDVVTSFSGQAAAGGVGLTAEAGGAADELELVGDPDRLDQVLSNLVANALRYTPPGGQITVSAHSIPKGSLPGSAAGIRLSVQDTGSGIPAEDLPFIFDRFWRGDRSRQRQGGSGTGLGLAISRQLVQAHGGLIRVESPAGQGTTFIIDLPHGEKPA